jgi:signal transduction histidine kinase
VCPLLIQNAAEHPQFRNHPGVSLGLTRYLAVPIRDPSGAAIGTLCFLDGYTDQILGDQDVQFMSLLAMRVSAEVERERAIERRVAEHAALSERLAAANARLEASAEEKRRFVATIIHDLRQPLAAARTAAYLLRGETDPLERETCLDLLDDRFAALSGLVEELARYSELEAGRLPWRPQRVELRPLLEECLARAGPASRVGSPRRSRCCSEEGVPPVGESRGTLRLVAEFHPDLGEAEVDPSQLCHIVNNLLSNAVKFTPAGAVKLRGCPEGEEHWRLEVVDTGVGIAPEHLERIFDDFYQAPDSRIRGDRGLGLGLAIVRHLCATAGAVISVTSEPGCGTKFSLLFPRFGDEATGAYGVSDRDSSKGIGRDPESTKERRPRRETGRGAGLP